MKISKCASALISQVLTGAVFLLMIAAAVLLPLILERYGIGTEETRGRCTVILYLALSVAFGADVLLHFLLVKVRRGEVFTGGSVRCLRLLSWCCFAECVIFSALSFFLFLGIIIAFACAFMGMILRVVKNVIEEAVDIKTENDYTI